MKVSKTIQALKALGIAAIAPCLLSACMSPEEAAALNEAFDLHATIPQTPAPPTPVAPACFNERFVQPEAEISRSIDILFVMDTSGSMDEKRAKVADGISSFVAELPPQVDYQVAVMLAHGSKSAWSGSLYKYNNRRIFSSKTMSVNTIQTELRKMVLNTPVDAYGEQGEQGSYSLYMGLTKKFQDNQLTGFFRNDAALAIVFVSDENDICAPYVNDPLQPGLTSSERKLRDRDCKGGIGTQFLLDQIKTVQNLRPFMIGAVVHQDLTYKDSTGHEGYGYGAMELVQASGGVSTEISNGDYTQGLSAMGKLATRKLTLVLDYILARPNINLDTLRAQVDGRETVYTFDADSNEIHLSEGGDALSVIDINYCQKVVVPEPTPTSTSGNSAPSTPPGTPNPNPSPTPTFTMPVPPMA